MDKGGGGGSGVAFACGRPPGPPCTSHTLHRTAGRRPHSEMSVFISAVPSHRVGEGWWGGGGVQTINRIDFLKSHCLLSRRVSLFIISDKCTLSSVHTSLFALPPTAVHQTKSGPPHLSLLSLPPLLHGKCQPLHSNRDRHDRQQERRDSGRRTRQIREESDDAPFALHSVNFGKTCGRAERRRRKKKAESLTPSGSG